APEAPAPGWGWDTTLAVAMVMWLSFLHGVSEFCGPVHEYIDAANYHLYFPVRWWKAGSLFLVATPFGDNATTYFPCVGEMGFCWLLIGWGGERPAKVGQVPFLLAGVLAIFGAARRLGASTSAAIIAIAWFVCVPEFLTLSFQANVDTVFVAGYLLAVY